jgi:hypothetical protein
MASSHAISQQVASSGTAAPPVVAVFGLEDAASRWLTLALRESGVVAVRLQPDLGPAAAHSVVAAVDAGVHVVSARRGMDATFLEYWQLLAEMGRARYVAVHDLGPVSLDVNEAAAIASRVLEEDVHPITMPLLADDESVIGVLDVVTGEQWFPDGTVEAPRTDFVEAVAAETNVLLDESGGEVMDAVAAGELAVAVTVESATLAGVGWLAAHLPERRVPASSVVLPGDDADMPFVGAGDEGLRPGRVLAVLGVEAVELEVTSLADVLSPGLLDLVPAGHVAAARLEPVPPVGSLLLTR